MNNDELFKLFRENPQKVHEMLEGSGSDFREMAKELDIGRKMVVDRYGLSPDVVLATEFALWISYFVEREINDTIFEIETKVIKRNPDEVKAEIDEMNFGQKIAKVVKNYIGNRDDDYINAIRKIKKIRNDMAHGRIESLSYKSYPLWDFRGQNLLLIDLMNAALSKKEY